jgi:hypothetical protein
MKLVATTKKQMIIVSRTFERLAICTGKSSRRDLAVCFLGTVVGSPPLVNARRDKEGRNVVVCKYPFYAELPGPIPNDAFVSPNTSGYQQVLMYAEFLLELAPPRKRICNQVVGKLQYGSERRRYRRVFTVLEIERSSCITVQPSKCRPG